MTEEQKQSQLKAACKFIDENYDYTRQDAFEDYYEFSYPCLSEALVEFADSETRWISIEDEEPIKDTDVLVLSNYLHIFPAMFDGFLFHNTNDFLTTIKHVTHWMPTPKLPKEGGEQ